MKRLALCALPLLLIGSVLLAAWPGYLSFDAAFGWYQARTGQFADIAPPMLAWLWSLLLGLGLPATSGPLLLIGGLHGGAFATLAWQAQARDEWRLAWLIALAGPCCPLLVLLLPHVWTDVLLSGVLLTAFALLAGGARGWAAQLGLGILLIIACGVRHNGILAVLPLLCWWALLLRPVRGGAVWQSLGVLLGLLALVWSTNAVLVRALDITRLDTWAVTPLFDLQAVSVATGQQRLPESVVGPGMDVAQLRAAFQPYSATRLFDGTESGVSNPTVAPLQAQQRSELLQAWRELPFESAWWSHRLRLFRGLLGSHRAPELVGLADSPMLQTYADNPPLTRRFPEAHARYRQGVDGLRNSWVYAPGLYLLLGVLALAVAWLQLRRQRDHRDTRSAAPLGALALSIGAYTLPYLVLAPSAETRYLLWPALASWVLLLLTLGRWLERNKA